MRLVTAPEHLTRRAGESSVFLAGGITGCPDWQEVFCSMLIDVDDLVLLNPRRRYFDISNPSASRQQIEWEYHMLHAADMIVFWFPKETLCPITLFELGSWLNHVPAPVLAVGVHPDYARLTDVYVQCALAAPNVPVVADLESLTRCVREFVRCDGV